MEKILTDLYEQIEKANYFYYTMDDPIISDQEYDELYQELLILERKYPQEKLRNSPTEKVGSKILDKFEKVNRKIPMLSLDNAFDKKDIVKFSKNIENYLGTKEIEYVCEVKIDGLAISIHYNNTVDQASTRGDGTIGEDVTNNVLTIRELPKFLKHSDFEVRGEVYISKKQFENINNHVDKKYANPRNLAAGSIRQLDSKVAMNRKLQLFCYGLVEPEKYSHSTYFESMNFLKKLGFPINSELKKFSNIEDVWEYISKINEFRQKLEYDIDGIVIKVNSYEQQKKLGTTSKFPKWAIAYKFKSDIATTKLNDIIWTVGKTGKITPNAILEPVTLMGSEISRASLYNLQYIIDNKIVKNSNVEIIKAGDVIPRVTKVVQYFDETIVVDEINECPICYSKLITVENDYYCINQECSGINKEKIKYFIGKSAFDIDGLGESTIERLYDLHIISNFADIFNLDYEKIEKLEGFGKKSIENLKVSISNKKNISFERLINSLSIPSVGLEIATQITKKFSSLEELKMATVESLMEIDKIGTIIAGEIVDYFKDEKNICLINNLLENGVKIIVKENIEIMNNEFTNKKIVITGTFEKYSRAELKEKIKLYGSQIVTSISKNTDYLLVGENPGSKYDKAIELGINILTEKEIGDLI